MKADPTMQRCLPRLCLIVGLALNNVVEVENILLLYRTENSRNLKICDRWTIKTYPILTPGQLGERDSPRSMFYLLHRKCTFPYFPHHFFPDTIIRWKDSYWTFWLSPGSVIDIAKG